MRNVIYAGSFDPAHNGHLNTYLNASRILNEQIKICICYNELKGNGLFDLNERINIAKATFPTDAIFSYRTNADIRTMICNADLIVRGYRKKYEQFDKDYSMRLLSHYNCEEYFGKIWFIEIDAEYESVSSSMIKDAAKSNINPIANCVTKEAFSLISHKFNKLRSDNDRLI